MGIQCYLGGTTLHTLKLATIPTSSSSSRFIFRPIQKTLGLDFLSGHSRSQKSSISQLVRSLSTSAAVQTSPVTPPPTTIPEDKVVKPQWKAAIDFKWIRDNKKAVAVNIKNRNFNANLELVLELYERMFNIQKEVERVRGERNMVANQMKGKLEPSERQKIIE